jgi:hypothetical protein
MGPSRDLGHARDTTAVALLFTSDARIAADGFVLLDDDKHLQIADNVARSRATRPVEDGRRLQEAGIGVFASDRDGRLRQHWWNGEIAIVAKT